MSRTDQYGDEIDYDHEYYYEYDNNEYISCDPEKSPCFVNSFVISFVVIIFLCVFL